MPVADQQHGSPPPRPSDSPVSDSCHKPVSVGPAKNRGNPSSLGLRTRGTRPEDDPAVCPSLGDESCLRTRSACWRSSPCWPSSVVVRHRLRPPVPMTTRPLHRQATTLARPVRLRTALRVVKWQVAKAAARKVPKPVVRATVTKAHHFAVSNFQKAPRVSYAANVGTAWAATPAVQKTPKFVKSAAFTRDRHSAAS